jgi:hypothetical protein
MTVAPSFDYCFFKYSNVFFFGLSRRLTKVSDRNEESAEILEKG